MSGFRIRRRLRKLRELGVGTSVRQARDRFDKLDVVQFGLRGLLIPFRVRHVAGPRAIQASVATPVVFGLVRDGRPWLKSFLAHHRALGFRHFVILDNGSSDGTVEALADEPDVILLASTAPYRAYENTMKRYVVNRFGRDRWCLFVDIDEQFNYPMSDIVPLDRFIGYLEDHRYTAVATQMLDLFADRPLIDCTIDQLADLTSLFRFYDLGSIRKSPYPFADTAPIAMHWGGIRKLLFDTDNGLTKISFFKNVSKLKPFVEWHHITGGRIADVSAVLLHYPFVNTFAIKVAEAVKSGRYGYRTSDEYAAYHRLAMTEGFRMSSAQADRLNSVSELVDRDFLIASKRYQLLATNLR